MKVLVTGASGFIGKHLINKFLEENHVILALSRNHEFNSNDKVKYLKVDLSNSQSYKEEIIEFQPDVLVHLAWQDIPDFSFEKSYLNLKISLEFISFVTNLGSCKKIIVSGSCFEYYNPNGSCIEDVNEIPNNYFTWAKLSLKSFLEVECKNKNISYVWLRIFYVFGSNQRLASLIPTILRELKKNKLPMLKTPKNANDFIFIEDVIEGFYSAMIREIPNGIYNLGSGSSTQVLEICKLSEKIALGTESLSQELENMPVSETNKIDFWADIEKSKNFLKWSPKVSLKEGLEKTWSWIQTYEEG